MGRVSKTLAAALICTGVLQAGTALAAFPQYDHVFLLIEENEGANNVIGSAFAPILNALAADYGLATNYRGVADPSEPNYVAMLGGSTFGISSDDPYWFPGQSVSADNLLSQLEVAGKTWRGYFQDMPYAGYRGYCYPDKCNGIPDFDTQYVSKHNGIVNFTSLQTPTELANMKPYQQLASDLAAGTVPQLSYIVPDECNDSHGAPPWCVDSGKFGSVQQNWLIAKMDAFIGTVVNQITSSALWMSGNNAIVITFDEGNSAKALIATVVITSHGPRGVTDRTAYDHYALLATLQQTFGGLPCLVNSCTATPMAPLFAVTGSQTVPALPPPFNFPTSTDTVSAQGNGKPAGAFSPAGSGWQIAPSLSFGSTDNILAGVSAASQTDAWAVGTYSPSSGSPLATLAHHWDGTRWTAFALPNVGVQQNSLLGVSMPTSGKAWAVGYYESGQFQQQTLIEHFDGSSWSVVPSPSPGARQNILYGVTAISDSDVWAVGAQQDGNGVWRTLAEHWNGSAWSVVSTIDAGSSGNQLYAVKALATNSVYATGQQAGAAFPNQALIEHWDGKTWSIVTSPSDSASALPLGLTATATSLTLVGQQESDSAPYTTYVAAGSPSALAIQASPNVSGQENDLFGAETAADGSTWAVGWAEDTSSDVHAPLVLQGINGSWSMVMTPSLKGDSGLAAIAAIPGGGLWAVGETSGQGNYSTLIEYHP
jgi:hypothetical protein